MFIFITTMHVLLFCGCFMRPFTCSMPKSHKLR
jgi:hypothetical protein